MIYTLEHVSARIVVFAGSQPGKWVSSRRFRDSFSLSVHEPSAFVNRQDGCRATERNFSSLEASAALSIFSLIFSRYYIIVILI